MIRRSVPGILFLTVIILLARCGGDETHTYDDLRATGQIEEHARSTFRPFFQAVDDLADRDVSAVPDSGIIGRLAPATENLLAETKPFPGTVRSRLAVDALALGAADIMNAPVFDHPNVQLFWREKLVDRLVDVAERYMQQETYNTAAHMQLVTAIRDAVDGRADDAILLDLISVVGPAPDRRVLDFCEADSLVFKHIYDLIVYSRSLQKVAPPNWLMSGPWLLAVDVNGFPNRFFALKPLFIDDTTYLSFKDFNNGEVYSRIYRDPVPRNSADMDDWLARAAGVMNSLSYDSAFVKRVRDTEFPLWDTHNFYNDLLLHTHVDTVKQEFHLIFKREKLEQNAFQFAGIDSLDITFDYDTIINDDPGDLTTLPAERIQGASLEGGRFAPTKHGEGTAYLIPVGTHDPSLIRRQQFDVNDIRVNTAEPPPGF